MIIFLHSLKVLSSKILSTRAKKESIFRVFVKIFLKLCCMQGRGDRGGVGGCDTPPIILSVKKLVKQASQLVCNC